MTKRKVARSKTNQKHKKTLVQEKNREAQFTSHKIQRKNQKFSQLNKKIISKTLLSLILTYRLINDLFSSKLKTSDEF